MKKNNEVALNTIEMPPFIEANVSLKEKNWFKTGGNAHFFAKPKTSLEFQHVLSFSKSLNLPMYILGEGANVLVSDEGFEGTIISPALDQIKHQQIDEKMVLVTAGSGVSMSSLINYCLDNNLRGLEEFSGIPGTVGGSVYINLHYFEFLLSQFLVSAQVIDKTTSEILTVNNDWFEFGYNTSKLLRQQHYLLSATFKLEKVSDLEIAYAKGRQKEIIRHRKQRYPNSHTCGSFFRNFKEDEVALISNGKKMIFVAYYLDKIGIKGQLKVGDAIVSYQHANMIVNQGNATSADIISLARTMQELVKNQFGIIPQPECRFIGFKEYSLL